MEKLLRDIAEIGAGQGAPQGEANYCDDGIPFVKAGNLQELLEGKSINNIQKVSDEVAKKHKLKLFPKGTILFAKSGMSCLKGYVYVLSRDAYVVSHLACITPYEDMSEYLQLYFNYHRPNQLVKDSSYPSISLSDIGNLKIDVKEDNHRKQIVTILKNIQRITLYRKQQLQQLDDLIKARFVEMFGLIQDTVPLSHYIISLTAGKSLAGEEECQNKVLKTGAATYDSFDPTQVKNLPVDYEPLPEHQVHDGDVIISRMNTAELVGAAAYIWKAPEKTYLPDRLWRADLRNNVNPIFLWQSIVQPETKKAIRKIAGGTSGSMKNISKPGLLGLYVKNVEIVKQNQFAAFVAQVDKSKSVRGNQAINLRWEALTLFWLTMA